MASPSLKRKLKLPRLRNFNKMIAMLVCDTEQTDKVESIFSPPNQQESTNLHSLAGSFTLKEVPSQKTKIETPYLR